MGVVRYRRSVRRAFIMALRLVGLGVAGVGVVRWRLYEFERNIQIVCFQGGSVGSGVGVGVVGTGGLFFVVTVERVLFLAPC